MAVPVHELVGITHVQNFFGTLGCKKQMSEWGITQASLLHACVLSSRCHVLKLKTELILSCVRTVNFGGCYADICT